MRILVIFILCFGNSNKAFKIVDNLFKNYVALDGEYKKDLTIKYAFNLNYYGGNSEKMKVEEKTDNFVLTVLAIFS